MSRSISSSIRDEKLLTTKVLANWTPTKKKGRWHTVFMNRPIDVVGKDLCDDVVKYLAPTLKKHKGCTIVDFFPGASIFSSILHNFLKPKSHILIEPEDIYFEPFINPLLDTPGSTYRHLKLPVDAAKVQWYRYCRGYAEYTPEISSQESGHAGSSEFNPNVLVIGNVARVCKFGGTKLGDSPFGLGILRQLSGAALSHELFNQNGPVRMFWWIPERYKPAVIPPHYMYARSNLSASLETAYNVSEVAGVQPSAVIKHGRRTDYTERERSDVFKELNRQEVAERMQGAGLALPEGRKFLSIYRSEPGPDSGFEYKSPLSGTAQTIGALRNQMQHAQERLDGFSKWIPISTQADRLKGEAKASRDADTASVQYPQCSKGKEHYPHMRARFVNNNRFAVLSDMALRLANIEAGYTELKERNDMTEADSDDLRSQIKSLNKTFWSLIEGENSMGPLIEEYVEEQLTFYSSSPISALGRRAYEPLQAQTSDFYPEHNLTLIDFMPRSIDLSVPDLASRSEATRFLKDLLKHLYAHKSKPVPEALDKAIGINAGRDLVDMVPEITDIRKGGRLDPNELKVRALTPEMIEGLVKAFFEWPFRPETWQLSLTNDKDLEIEEAEKGRKRVTEDALEEV